MDPAIVLDGVTKDFGNIRAVNGLDLAVEGGEFFAFEEHLALGGLEFQFRKSVLAHDPQPLLEESSARERQIDTPQLSGDVVPPHEEDPFPYSGEGFVRKSGLISVSAAHRARQMEDGDRMIVAYLELDPLFGKRSRSAW